jgi:hypothetical protein
MDELNYLKKTDPKSDIPNPKPNHIFWIITMTIAFSPAMRL